MSSMLYFSIYIYIVALYAQRELDKILPFFSKNKCAGIFFYEIEGGFMKNIIHSNLGVKNQQL